MAVYDFYLRVPTTSELTLHRGKFECATVRGVFGKSGKRGGKSADWFGYQTRDAALAAVDAKWSERKLSSCLRCRPMNRRGDRPK